jgi:acyl carrier protein
MDIAERILGFIRSELGRGAGRAVEPDTPLLTGLIDSLQIMELASFVEETFGVSLGHADVNEANFRDVHALVALISQKLG